MSEIRRLVTTTATIISLSTITFSILEPHQIISPFDGLYFSVITLTTVGFGDKYPSSPLGKVFTMMLSILGLGIFQALVDVVGQWRDRYLVPILRSKDKPVRDVGFTLITLILFGSLLFSIAEGWSIQDSAYFSLVTATTVGYGDMVPESPTGKIAAIIYALLSLAPMAYVVGEVKDFLLSGTSTEKAKEE